MNGRIGIVSGIRFDLCGDVEPDNRPASSGLHVDLRLRTIADTQSLPNIFETDTGSVVRYFAGSEAATAIGDLDTQSARD